jgi:hypothetical protein
MAAGALVVDVEPLAPDVVGSPLFDDDEEHAASTTAIETSAPARRCRLPQDVDPNSGGAELCGPGA